MRFRIDGVWRLRICAGLLALLLSFTAPSSAQEAAPSAQAASSDPDAAEVSDGSPQTRRTTIGGINCAYWLPPAAYSSTSAVSPLSRTAPSGAFKRYPLVIFSHGFHGTQTQSTFLMKALASAGYIAISPTHADALGKHMLRPPVPFAAASKWNEQSARYREQDIKAILSSLPTDPRFCNITDFDSIALAGHSLGGYTVLALAGAWPSWKLPRIKAVLGLSPFVSPFVASHTLGSLNIPVMYQGGTRDFGITPSIARTGGAFDQTGGDVWFLNFDNFNHFSWTDLNLNRHQRDLVRSWSIWFLNRYVRGINAAPPSEPLPQHHEVAAPQRAVPSPSSG